MNIKRFDYLLESLYKQFFISKLRKENHPFFTDIEDVTLNQQYKDSLTKDKNFDLVDFQIMEKKRKKSYSNEKESLDEIIKNHFSNKNEKKNEEKKKYLSSNEISYLFSKINEYIPENSEQINKILAPMDYSELPGTIMPNEWNMKLNYWKLTNKQEKDTFFILILGSGPMGLFVANYIHFLKKSGLLRYYKNIQILLLENRIGSKPGYKKPYSRNRPFQFSTEYFSLILSKLYCQKIKHYIPIKLLEDMFYLASYNNGIPMYFTKEYDSWDSLKKLVEELNIQVIFDCTGGRFNIPKKWIQKDNPSWYPYDLKHELGKIEWNTKKNRYEYIWNSVKDITQLPLNKYYLSIDIMKNGILFQNKTEMIRDIETLAFFKKVVEPLGKISKNIFYKLIPFIPSKKIQKHFLFYFYEWQIQNLPNIEIEIKFFEIEMYYRSKIAHSFSLKNNKKCIYIGLGDTIFHSHFIVGAGLNRLIPLGVQIIHLLPLLMIQPEKNGKLEKNNKIFYYCKIFF